MKKVIQFLAFALCLLACGAVWANTPAPSYAYQVTDMTNGSIYLIEIEEEEEFMEGGQFFVYMTIGDHEYRLVADIIAITDGGLVIFETFRHTPESKVYVVSPF